MNDIRQYRLPPSETNIAEVDILTIIVETLDKAIDFNYELSKVIHLVGNEFLASKILILKSVDNAESGELIHEWAADSNETFNSTLNLNVDKCNVGMVNYLDYNNVYYCADNCELTKEQRAFLGNSNSRLSYIMKLDGEVIGCIDISSTKEQVWTQEQLKTIILCCKIINKYLCRQWKYGNSEDKKKSIEWTLDKRIDFIFGQSCHVICEVDLETEVYIQTILSNEIEIPLPSYGKFTPTFQYFLTNIIFPADETVVSNTFSMDIMRNAAKLGEKETVCEFRMLQNHQKVIWIEGRVFYIHEEDHFIALIIIRNISERKEKEKKLKISEQYATALKEIYNEVYEINITQNSYHIVYHIKGKYVVPPEEGELSSTIIEVADKMIDPADKQRFLEFFNIDSLQREFVSGKESVIGEFRKLWVDGKYRWSSLTVFPLKQDENNDEIYLCFVMDISDKKHFHEIEEQNNLLHRQQIADERYRVIVEQTGTIVFEWDRNNNERLIPPEIISKFAGNYDERDLLQIWHNDKVVHTDDLELFNQFRENLKSLNTTKYHDEMVVRLKTRDKDYLWCRISFTGIPCENGGLQRIVGTINDIDDEVKSEKAMKYRAEFDMLTGIFNTQAFDLHTDKMLLDKKGKKYALIRLDINKFKFINEMYGFEEGNKLLKYIAEIISISVLEGGTYGRLGGDVFCICTEYQNEQELICCTKKITAALSEYNIGYKPVPYFGICPVNDMDVPVSILCDRASLALKTIKGNMVTNYAFYDTKLRDMELEERTIENEMANALAQGQFTVYLQPKHNILSKKIIGAEALVRWQHPREGLLLPFRFIPLFERDRFIIHLDEYVWEQTFKTIRKWIDMGYEPVPISMNVSRIHIYNPGFFDKLIFLAEKYKLPHKLIELELTESTFIENIDELYETMRTLQNSGFLISMDDFGSGYSSLNMLKNVCINTIKLDREFFNETVSTQKGKIVIQYTIEMANKLNLTVIAEGVETQSQADFLLQAGCTLAQGYYYSKPMPIDEFEVLAFGDTEGCENNETLFE